MTQVRKFTGLAFASLAGAALVSWLGAGLLAMWLGPSWFSAELHQRAGIDAAIGSLRTDFFHAVSFRDIVLSSPVRGTVDEVRVSFRPWDLFSMRARRRQIFAITLRHPVLTIDAKHFSTGSTTSMTPLRLVPFGATVENGEVTVKATERDWTVSKLNGYGRVTPFRLEADAEGNVNEWGQLRAHLRAGTGAPRNWEFRLDSDRLAAATALALAPARVVDRVGQLTGDVRLNAVVRGAFPRRIQISDWRVGATSLNVAWLPPGQRAPLPVSGSIGVTKKKVILDDFRVARTTLNGAATPPWNAPRLDFKVTADHQPLPPFLLALFPDRAGFLDGSVSGTGSIAGTAPNPRAQMNLDGDVRIGALHLPHASGTASLNDGTVLAAVDVASGHLQIHGAAVTSAPRWNVEAERLALADIAQVNGWKNVAGTVDGRFGYDAANAAASGEFSADGLRWGRLRMGGRHQASLRMAHGRLDATGDNGGLILSAAATADGINVTDFRFSLGGGTMTVAGAYQRKNRGLDFTAHAVDLPLALWPPLIDRYPDATGVLSANGSIRGTLDRPESEWDVHLDHARLRAGSGDSTARGKFSTAGPRVQLSEADVDGTILLSGQADAGRRAWSLDARLNEASPQLLADLARSSETVTGSISGFLTAAGGDHDVAASSFTWSTGHVGNFYFDELAATAHRDGDVVRIDQASVIRGPQALRGQATFRRGSTTWAFDAIAQVQQWTAGAAKLDGEIGAEGTVAPDTRSVKATVTAPVFWVADRRLESVSADVIASPNGARITATAGDDQMTLEASVDRSLALRGHLAGHDLPLEDLFAPDRTKSDEPLPAGVYDADVTLAGTAYAPEAEARLAVRKGVWREEGFSATSAVHLSTGGVLIRDAAADFDSGGHVSARGAITSGKDGGVALEGEAQALSVQALFHLLDWPVTWSGTTDGTFTVAHDTTGITADIRFDGEHDGFAAVKEGGDFHGRVVGRGNEWSLLGIHVEAGDGHLDVNDRSKLYVDRNGGGTFQILADVRNIQTGPLTYFGGAEVVGRWRAPDPDGNGGHPVDLDVFARSLFINQFVLDGNVAHLAVANQKLVFSPIPGSGQQIGGTLSYEKYPDLLVDGLRFLENGVERVALNGNVGTRTWDFSLTTHGLDAGIVRGLLDFQPTMSGAMNIELKAQGSPTEPLIQSKVAWTNGRFGILPLDSAEAKVNYARGELSVTDAVAQRRRGYQAQGDARFGIGEAGDKLPMEVNLRIDKGDMALLADMIPEVSKARGSFDGRLRVGGSAGNAAISGYLNARKFSLNSAHLPDVSKGEMRLRIERNRLTIDRAVARVGQGQLEASGHVDFHNGLPSRYDVALRSGKDHGIAVRVPELDIAPGTVLGRFNLLKKSLAGVSRGEPVIDLALKGPADAPTISGDILLENSVFTYPPGGRGVTSGAARAVLSRLNWDVNLHAGRRCWYQNELVDANVTGTLAFEGPTSDLGVKGRIDATQGSIVYSGNEFRVKDATLEVETQKEALSDVKQTTVYLKANAEREVFYTDALNNSNQDIIVMVVDRAPIGEIQPRFYAKNNPGLSSQRALQLALGLPFNDNIDANSLLPDQRARISENANNDQLLRLGLVQLLDSNLASPLARALARRTGLVDYIRVSYQQNDPHGEDGSSVIDAASNNNATQNEFLKYAKGTQVKFGRGLGSRLYADYSFRVDEFESQLNLRHQVELAYRVHRNLFLRGTSELDAQRELGRPPDRRAILENQWRFGLPRGRPAKPASSAAETAADKSAG